MFPTVKQLRIKLILAIIGSLTALRCWDRVCNISINWIWTRRASPHIIILHHNCVKRKHYYFKQINHYFNLISLKPVASVCISTSATIRTSVSSKDIKHIICCPKFRRNWCALGLKYQNIHLDFLPDKMQCISV